MYLFPIRLHPIILFGNTLEEVLGREWILAAGLYSKTMREPGDFILKICRAL